MRKKQIVSGLIGILLLIASVAWIGPETLYQQLIALKWVLPLLILMGLVKNLLRAWSWRQAMLAEGVQIGFLEILRVRIGSQAVAYLSSMGMVVSEPLKPWLLRNVAAYSNTIPATLVEAAIYWVVSLLVLTVGAFVAINMVADTHDAVMLSLICLGASVAVLSLLFTRTSITPRLGALVERRFPARSGWISGLRKAGEMEGRIRSFRHRHPETVAGILGIHALVQIVMFAEVWIVLSAVGLAVGFLYLLAIEAASRTVKIMSLYLPGRVGADEAGGAASFLLLGLNPAAGLTLAIARRIQAICWTAVGLGWLGRRGIGKKPETTGADFPVLVDPVAANREPQKFPDSGPRLVTQDR